MKKLTRKKKKKVFLELKTKLEGVTDNSTDNTLRQIDNGKEENKKMKHLKSKTGFQKKVIDT